MKKKSVEGIQPEIIKWARITVGLSLADVASAIKSSVEEVSAWESGESAPSYIELERLAYTVFKRPMAVFFLPQPPDEIPPDREFRTLPELELQNLKKDTYLHIRKAHAFQLGLKEIFGDRNPAPKLLWKEIHASFNSSAMRLGEQVRNYLNITLEDQIKWRDEDLSLKKWRNAIERVGVFVFKAPFKQKDISGFCLKHDQFPLIFLNNSTTKTRQIFSLMHELVHLLLDISGISKLDESVLKRLSHESEQIERFCNAVAAEILIPSKDFNQHTKKCFTNPSQNVSESDLLEIASRYGVSREAILRRFLDQKKVTKAFYESKVKDWSKHKTKAGGGNWYASQGVYLSRTFLEKVIGLHYRNQIDLNQAADYLGIKPKSFPGLEERVLKDAEV